MNWKTLLVIASLTMSAGLTACSDTKTTTPDATTTTPAASPAASPAADGKSGDAMKSGDAKTTTTETKTEVKPASGTKTTETKTETKKP